jgi:hypothetical protein
MQSSWLSKLLLLTNLLLTMQIFFCLKNQVGCQCLGYQIVSFIVDISYQMHFQNEFYSHLNLHNNILLIDT